MEYLLFLHIFSFLNTIIISQIFSEFLDINKRNIAKLIIMVCI